MAWRGVAWRGAERSGEEKSVKGNFVSGRGNPSPPTTSNWQRKALSAGPCSSNLSRRALTGLRLSQENPETKANVSSSRRASSLPSVSPCWRTSFLLRSSPDTRAASTGRDKYEIPSTKDGGGIERGGRAGRAGAPRLWGIKGKDRRHVSGSAFSYVEGDLNRAENPLFLGIKPGKGV